VSCYIFNEEKDFGGPLWTAAIDNHGLAGSANPHKIFVITPRGEMASFPIGTTPFFLEIDSARPEFRARTLPHAG
jgi:hypothetical protein